jgi:hypothetical protein
VLVALSGEVVEVARRPENNCVRGPITPFHIRSIVLVTWWSQAGLRDRSHRMTIEHISVKEIVRLYLYFFDRSLPLITDRGCGSRRGEPDASKDC